MESQRRLICSKLFEFIDLGKNLGYFTEENNEFVQGKIERLTDIVFCDRIVGYAVIIESNNGPTLMVNPSIFDLNMKEFDRALFRELAHYSNGICDTKKGEKKSLAEEKFEANLGQTLKEFDSVSLYSVLPGLKMLDEAISNEIADSMVAYKNREARDNYVTVKPTYAQILYHTNFKENGISQELAINFSKLVYGDNSDKDAMLELIVNSFKKGYLTKVLGQYNKIKDANNVINVLHLMGIVQSAEQENLRGNIISFKDSLDVTTSYNKANAIMKENTKKREKNSNLETAKVNVKI